MLKLAIVVGHTNLDKGAYSAIFKTSEYVVDRSCKNRIVAFLSCCILTGKVFFCDRVNSTGAYAAGASGAQTPLSQYTSMHPTIALQRGQGVFTKHRRVNRWRKLCFRLYPQF